MTLPEMKTVRGSVFLSRMGDPALGRSTAPPEWGSPLRWAKAQGASVAIANVAASRERKEENAIGPPGEGSSRGTYQYQPMVVQKTGQRLLFAGTSEFGDDLLAHHLAAVIDDFNQAGARGAGIGHNRGEFRAGKQANNLPFILGTLDPKLVLFPLCHLNKCLTPARRYVVTILIAGRGVANGLNPICPA